MYSLTVPCAVYISDKVIKEEGDRQGGKTDRRKRQTDREMKKMEGQKDRQQYLLWCDQQQLSDGGGGGHGVAIDPMNLEGSGHAPHTLVC